jgi:hypothetical protein
MFVTPLGQSLNDISLVSHQPQETHNLLSAGANPPEHIALLGLPEDKNKLINAVDFVLNALNKGAKRIRDVVD